MTTHVPTTPDDLTRFVASIFEAVDVPANEARRVAGSLVESNLRGHDSHGVVRVADYVKQLGRGELAAGHVLLLLICPLRDFFAITKAVKSVGAIDGSQPRAQRADLGKFLLISEGLAEGFLRDIFGVFKIAQNGVALVDQLAAKLFDQFPQFGGQGIFATAPWGAFEDPVS